MATSKEKVTQESQTFTSLKTVELIDKLLDTKFSPEKINSLYVIKRPGAIDEMHKIRALRKRIIAHFATKS